MDLVPEFLDGAIVLNAVQSCAVYSDRCGACEEYAGGIRNWLLAHEIPYLIVDLQDEKEVCASFLTELVSLRRRLRCPFYFAGVMDRARIVLDTFNLGRTTTVFQSAHDAVAHLRSEHPTLLVRSAAASTIAFGEPVPIARNRTVGTVVAEGGQDGAQAEDDV